MPCQISQLKIINAVLDGIENAEKTYEQWSRGEWLAYSAEYVITVFVATSIMKIPGSKYLTIEHDCRDAIESACGKRRGKLARVSRPDGRIDLILWWASDSPRAVIEIKNNVYNYAGQCKADIDRIAHLLLMTNTTLQFGLFVFYTSADDGPRKKATDILTDRFNRVLSRVKKDCRKSIYVRGINKIHNYGNGAWLEACVILKRS